MNVQIRESVKNAMKEQELTQLELSEAMGIPQSSISRYLRGVSGEVPTNWQEMFDRLSLELIVRPKEKTPIEEKLEQLTTLHGEEWLLDRLEVLAALEEAEE